MTAKIAPSKAAKNDPLTALELEDMEDAAELRELLGTLPDRADELADLQGQHVAATLHYRRLAERFNGGDLSAEPDMLKAQETADSIGRRVAVVQRAVESYPEEVHYPKVHKLICDLWSNHEERCALIDKKRQPALAAERVALLDEFFSDRMIEVARRLVGIEGGPTLADDVGAQASLRLDRIEGYLRAADAAGHDVSPISQETPALPANPHEALIDEAADPEFLRWRGQHWGSARAA